MRVRIRNFGKYCKYFETPKHILNIQRMSLYCYIIILVKTSTIDFDIRRVYKFMCGMLAIMTRDAVTRERAEKKKSFARERLLYYPYYHRRATRRYASVGNLRDTKYSAIAKIASSRAVIAIAAPSELEYLYDLVWRRARIPAKHELS